MNFLSIEFDRIKEDSPSSKVIRKSFRVPVDSQSNLKVVIDHKPYLVHDICLDGVGITAKDSLAFCVDQSLTNCELILFNTSIKPLTGRIVHASIAFGEDWKFGIQWMNMDKDDYDRISAIVFSMKKNFLKNTDPAVDDI